MSVNYLLVSTAILLLAMGIYFFRFERRKPRAREVVLIAIMSSITVVANLVCVYTLPLHAGTAMVIISGIAFGPETGFLIGALSRFTCNFFMGQGVWTPWEMFAWGLLGALAGITFSKTVIIGRFDDKKSMRLDNFKGGLKAVTIPLITFIGFELLGYCVFLLTGSFGQESGLGALDNTDVIVGNSGILAGLNGFIGYRLYLYGIIGIIVGAILTRKKLPANVITMSVFTWISVFVIYGGIMNLAAASMSASGGFSLSLLKMLYITGAPYDAFHGLGAAACVFLFGESILQKLERIKIKYGMYARSHTNKNKNKNKNSLLGI